MNSDCNAIDSGGGCMFQTGLTCGYKNCEKCGFNPDNGVHEQRVETAMREYQRKVEDGKVIPVY